MDCVTNTMAYKKRCKSVSLNNISDGSCVREIAKISGGNVRPDKGKVMNIIGCKNSVHETQNVIYRKKLAHSKSKRDLNYQQRKKLNTDHISDTLYKRRQDGTIQFAHL